MCAFLCLPGPMTDTKFVQKFYELIAEACGAADGAARRRAAFHSASRSYTVLAAEDEEPS
jgi:hypothetical protein